MEISCRFLIDKLIVYQIFENRSNFNPLNAELNPICCLLALLGARHFLHVSRIRVYRRIFCPGRTEVPGVA
jgi:hypothetical protein